MPHLEARCASQASDYPGDVTHSNAESGSVVLAEEDQLRAVEL
jgi:hypothetical protein